MSINMRKFIPLTKVDESTHSVYGVVTAETPDKENEICDYEAAKKAYQTWSGELAKSTEAAGQEINYGNIRLQHSITMGGKVMEPVVFDDDTKSILLKSTPIDEDVWEKLKKGFFTGYSQGGDYAWRQCNECGTSIAQGSRCSSCKKSVAVRYAPIIAEVSYVDNPCHGDAHFELVKVDGTKEFRKFAAKGNPMDKQTETATGGILVLSDDDIARISKSAADRVVEALNKADAKTKRVAGEDLPASAFAYVGDPEKTATWKLPIKFSDEEKTKRHIRNALARFEQTKGIPADEKAKVKAKIDAAAKKHGIDVSDEAEKAEKVMRACEEIIKSVAQRKNISLEKLTADANALGLKKGMYELSCFAQILCDLYYLHNSSAFETEMEGDGSDMPEGLHDLLEQAAEKFLEMAEEEVNELTAASAEFHKTQGGTTVNKDDNNLSKAASAKAHIAKMKKAVSDHSGKMCEMHKAHQEEMDGHFAKLHKILGVEEADADGGSKGGTNEPEPEDPKKGGAPDGNIKTYSQAELDKAVADATKTAAEVAADLAVREVIKALKGEDDGDGEDGEDDGDGKDGKDGKPKKAAAAAGIGDRKQTPTIVAGAGPVVKVMPVRKEDDARTPAAAGSTSVTVDAETVRKSISGDQSSILAMMKTSTPIDSVPITVAGALGKIKH